MKKILTTALLLSAGTAIASAATVTYSSSLYESSTSTTHDATTIIYSGRSASGITDDSTYTTSGGSNAIYSANNSNLTSLSFLLSNLYTTDSTDETLYLNSFSVITRTDALTDISAVYITISDGNGVVATSGYATGDANVATNGVYGLATFSFAGDVALSTTTAYTVTFYGYSDTSGSSTSGFGVGAFKTTVSSGQGFGLNGSSLSGGTAYTYSANNQYQCVYSLTLSTVAIPEPSAFGLLAGLGALALVASRRRRRG